MSRLFLWEIPKGADPEMKTQEWRMNYEAKFTTDERKIAKGLEGDLICPTRGNSCLENLFLSQKMSWEISVWYNYPGRLRYNIFFLNYWTNGNLQLHEFVHELNIVTIQYSKCKCCWNTSRYQLDCWSYRISRIRQYQEVFSAKFFFCSGLWRH